MAEQDWLTAGVYLLGLLGTALAMSALFTRARAMRAIASTSTEGAGRSK